MPQPASPISLTRFLIEEQRHDHICADLRLLIEVVARACKTIAVTVGKGALGGVLGDAGGTAPDARRRLLELAPVRLHQRVPVFLCSRREVEEATRCHRAHDAAVAPAGMGQTAGA